MAHCCAGGHVPSLQWNTHSHIHRAAAPNTPKISKCVLIHSWKKSSTKMHCLLMFVINDIVQLFQTLFTFIKMEKYTWCVPQVFTRNDRAEPQANTQLVLVFSWVLWTITKLFNITSLILAVIYFNLQLLGQQQKLKNIL